MCIIFFFKQKTAYEMRISDWSSDVCSSDLSFSFAPRPAAPAPVAEESIEPEVQEVPFAATETEAAPVAEDRDPAPGFSLNDTAEAEVAAEEEPKELSQVAATDDDTADELVLGDRKSVGEGKSVSVRLDLGGRRIL